MVELSWNDSLAVFTDKIIDALDNGEHTIGLVLDLSKAFDIVNNNNILLSKRLEHNQMHICVALEGRN